jgi:hypothetical protein
MRFLFVALFIVLFGWGASLTAAQTQPTPTVPSVITDLPTQTPAAWNSETVLIFRAGVSFIWLRDVPRPDAPTRATLYPGTLILLQNGVDPQTDAFGQQWWLVRVPSLQRIGWVEQASLMVALPTATPRPTLTPTPSPTPLPTAIPVTPGGGIVALAALPPTSTPTRPPQTWRVPNILLVKPSVAKAFLRATPTSGGQVVDEVELGGLVIVQRSQPVWDGTGWWWFVQSSYSGKTGWVEQDILDSTDYKTQTPPPPAG